MEKINHWSESNTNALIQGLSGIAGTIIDKKQSGQQVSSAENQIANLSQQTLQALGLYNSQTSQQQQQQIQSTGIKSNNTLLLVGGGVLLLVVLFMVFKRK